MQIRNANQVIGMEGGDCSKIRTHFLRARLVVEAFLVLRE